MVLTVRAILHIFVEQGKLEDFGEVLAKIPEVINVYGVTGEYNLIATAKANNLHKLRSLISERLMNVQSASNNSIDNHPPKIRNFEMSSKKNRHLRMCKEVV